jgi:hypothetical protein
MLLRLPNFIQQKSQERAFKKGRGKKRRENAYWRNPDQYYADKWSRIVNIENITGQQALPAPDYVPPMPSRVPSKACPRPRVMVAMPPELGGCPNGFIKL